MPRTEIPRARLLFNRTEVTTTQRRFYDFCERNYPDPTMPAVVRRARAEQLAAAIYKIATEGQFRCQSFPIVDDQFIWAVGLLGLLGCISTPSGLNLHARYAISQPEADLIRQWYANEAYFWSGVSYNYADSLNRAFRRNWDLYRYAGSNSYPQHHVVTSRGIEETEVMVSSVASLFSGPPASIVGDHGLLATGYEEIITAARARESSHRVEGGIRKIDGEPRTSTRSVLYSRWGQPEE